LPVPLSDSTATAAPSRTNRITRLEAFRGLGATVVLLNHCLAMVPWGDGNPQVTAIKLICTFVNGHAFLMGFFVISGYVLGLSLDAGQGREHNIRRFYVRRVFRIYPAHVVSIVFIAAAMLAFDRTHPAAASEAFGRMFAIPLSAVGVLLNWILIRIDMNPVVWTLAVEIAVSLLLPIFHWASRRQATWIRRVPLLALIVLSFVAGDRIMNGGRAALIVMTPDATLRSALIHYWNVPEILNDLAIYAYLFYLGLVGDNVLGRRLSRSDGWGGTWLVGLVLLVTVSASTARDFASINTRPAFLLVESLGVTYAVFWLIRTRTRSWLTKALDSPFLTWLGTRSYSFYLYHFIALYGIASVMFRIVSPAFVTANPLVFCSVMFGLTFAVTTAVATASYRFVESPMIAYSKEARFSGRMTAMTLAAAIVLLALSPLAAAEWQQVTLAGPAQDTAMSVAAERESDLPLPDPVVLPVHLSFGDAATRRWMRRGWNDTEVANGRAFAWSEGRRSVLSAPIPDDRDVRMAFEALPFSYRRSPIQQVAIVVNGAKVGTVKLVSGLQRYSVVLPSTALHNAVDVIELQYADARMPKDVLKGATDARTLAVAWYSIDFVAESP
jgi:peptidoglycan/LPS O-acetylase OafA/YrhL